MEGGRRIGAAVDEYEITPVTTRVADFAILALMGVINTADFAIPAVVFAINVAGYTIPAVNTAIITADFAITAAMSPTRIDNIKIIVVTTAGGQRR